MNVFDWPGPDFLEFYFCFAVGVLVVQAAVNVFGERDGPLPDLSDPYLIAHLRGGAVEVLRVATIALVDRGLLKAEEADVVVEPGVDLRSATLPIEQALLVHFAQRKPPSSLARAKAALRACERYQVQLEELGLDPVVMTRRSRIVLAVAVVLLIAVAATKIVIALERGRTNIFFLVILAAVACLAAGTISKWRPFDRARRLLADLRLLLRGLRTRAQTLAPGNATGELALLAAVFGLWAVPLTLFPARDQLFRREIESESAREARRRRWRRDREQGGCAAWYGCSAGSSPGDSSSGSSCGSGGSSGGSSCGGGGGGGCGGCGGGS